MPWDIARHGACAVLFAALLQAFRVMRRIDRLAGFAHLFRFGLVRIGLVVALALAGMVLRLLGPDAVADGRAELTIGIGRRMALLDRTDQRRGHGEEQHRRQLHRHLALLPLDVLALEALGGRELVERGVGQAG